MVFHDFSRSLVDLLGECYVHAVCRASAFCTGEDYSSLFQRASQPVTFWSREHTDRLDNLVEKVGTGVCPPFGQSSPGAGTESFNTATRIQAAPLSGFGLVRIGEDGRAYLIGKSEHYHVSLGHRFPGFNLLDVARSVGVLHPEHNNLRGHITRLLEERLISAAAGIDTTDSGAVHSLRESRNPRVLNRIINLQTGSLAAEAALKMMLARFYRVEKHHPAPVYYGRRPVILVMGDYSGGLQANYHGTTLVTQMLRGLWPEFESDIAGALEIVPVPINDFEAFRSIVERHDTGASKVAGFFHEFVLMNYGGIRLDPRCVQSIYGLCESRDIPIAADEIQSGAWSGEYFFFREYGVTPDFVALGKGFPGGEYAASKIMTTSAMDNLDQFGALVTNGQEEIASLAYLVVMETIREYGDIISEIGSYYRAELERLASEYPQLIRNIDGVRHLASIFFYDPDIAEQFAKGLNARCIDISTHSYKAESLPAALTKLPIIATRNAVDFLIRAMREALDSIQGD